ncbi:MAG: twin-arginine translocation signal domain-containing protein [Myxococcales bacterium]|nr:twin-arginine translocation signal domain-containing protein [Myxococcales bacterium]
MASHLSRRGFLGLSAGASCLGVLGCKGEPSSSTEVLGAPYGLIGTPSGPRYSRHRCHAEHPRHHRIVARLTGAGRRQPWCAFPHLTLAEVLRDFRPLLLRPRRYLLGCLSP